MKNNLYKDLLDYDYYNLNNNKKMLVIDSIIKYYLISVIDEYNEYGYLFDKYSTKEIIDYFENHYSLIPVILFVIDLINNNQYNKISWMINTNLDNTRIIKNGNEVDKIISNEKYSEVLNTIYDYYLDLLDTKALKK